MTLSDIASGLSGGADGRVVIGVTAEPVSIIAVARRVGAAWTNRAILSPAPVELAVLAVRIVFIAFIIFRIDLLNSNCLNSSLGDNILQNYCILHLLKEGIDLSVGATLGGASKRCDQAQGKN